MLRLWKGLGTLTASGLGFRASGWGLVGLSRVYRPGPDDISQSSSHAIAYRFQH